MEIARRIIQTCLDEQIYPEYLFGLQNFLKNKKAFPLGLNFDSAMKEFYDRLPDAFKMCILFKGVDSAEIVKTISSSCFRENSKVNKQFKKMEFNELPCYNEFINIYKVGISLSWLFLGVGDMMYLKPNQGGMITQLKATRDYLENAKIRQNWDNQEIPWIGIVSTKSKVPIIHKGICRLFAGLPPMRVFPDMPDVIAVKDKILDMLLKYDPPKSSEPWITECLIAIREKKWLVSSLFFVSQSIMSCWRSKNTTPRLIIFRYAWLVNVIIEIYKEEGLWYILRCLNEEAKACGYKSLTSVVRAGKWNVNQLRKSQTSRK